LELGLQAVSFKLQAIEECEALAARKLVNFLLSSRLCALAVISPNFIYIHQPNCCTKTKLAARSWQLAASLIIFACAITPIIA
jgi:hypothetical protein